MARRRRYRTTAKQVAASRRNLEKARAARKRKGRHRVAAVAGTGVALGTGALVARHKISGSQLSVRTGANVSDFTGSKLNRGLHRTTGGFRASTKNRKVTVAYKHKKVSDSPLGKKIAGAPERVREYRPPNATEKANMARFNRPMGPDATAAARIKYEHTVGRIPEGPVRGMPKARLKTQHKPKTSGPSMKRGRGFANSGPFPDRKSFKGTKARGTRRTRSEKISQYEAALRTTAYMSSLPHSERTGRNRRRAMRYYSQQPLYTGTGTPGRRGRKRSREQRSKRK